MSIGGQIKHAAHKAEHGVKHAADKVKDGVEGGANKAKDGVDKLDPDRIIHQVEDAITKQLPKLIQQGIEEIQKDAVKAAVGKGLNAAIDIIELVSPNSFTLVLGIEAALIIQAEFTISVSIPNPVSKLFVIKGWARNPPHGRSKIIKCIKDFAPSSLEVEAKFSGNGGSAVWDGDDKFDKLNKFLKKQGI